MFTRRFSHRQIWIILSLIGLCLVTVAALPSFSRSEESGSAQLEPAIDMPVVESAHP